MFSQSLILALQITRVTAIRSVTTIFLAVYIQLITLPKVLLVNEISENEQISQRKSDVISKKLLSVNQLGPSHQFQ